MNDKNQIKICLIILEILIMCLSVFCFSKDLILGIIALQFEWVLFGMVLLYYHWKKINNIT